MEKWTLFLDKFVKIIFEDGPNHISMKIGLLVEVNSTHAVIKIKERPEAILLSKILRMELSNGN